MHRDFLFGIGLLASVAAGAGSAIAADMPVRPPPVAAPVTCCAVPDWVGFYVGIHGGGGWARESIELSEFNNFGINFVTPADTRPSGGVFGFQFGHNWQWGPVVGGLEIDFSGADIKGTSASFVLTDGGVTPATITHDFKIDELASARGRLGYLIFPNWLLYGTAGIGWGHFRFSSSIIATDGDFASVTQDANEFGWVAGVGLEWKLAPNWLLRGEWLHYDFARVSHAEKLVFEAFNPVIDNGNSRVTVDVARAALSYKF